MNITFEPINITKELILSRIPEEKIFEHYLGVPIKRGLFVNPCRNDDRPTCSYYTSKGGHLMMKDFAGFFCGDCISLVMYKFKCSYYIALQIIANDFGIIHRKDLKINKPKIEYTGLKLEQTQGAIIQVQIKDFESYELDWWKRYGVTEQTLKKFNVYSCKNVFLNGNLFYLEKTKQYVFGYYGGIKNNIEQWRIYFPKRHNYRFISNWKCTQMQGGKQLNKDGGDILVITKSLKDVLCLYEYGIPAIAPCSENEFVTEVQYQKLRNKFKHIFLLYDNDAPGIHASWKIHKKYPELPILFIPRKSGCKDFSDFRKKHGHKKTLQLIQQAKDYYNL